MYRCRRYLSSLPASPQFGFRQPSNLSFISPPRLRYQSSAAVLKEIYLMASKGSERFAGSFRQEKSSSYRRRLYLVTGSCPCWAFVVPTTSKMTQRMRIEPSLFLLLLSGRPFEDKGRYAPVDQNLDRNILCSLLELPFFAGNRASKTRILDQRGLQIGRRTHKSLVGQTVSAYPEFAIYCKDRTGHQEGQVLRCFREGVLWRTDH